MTCSGHGKANCSNCLLRPIEALGGELIDYPDDQRFSHDPAPLCEGAGCRSVAVIQSEWDEFTHDPREDDPSTDEITPHAEWLAEMMRFVAAISLQKMASNCASLEWDVEKNLAVLD